MIPLTIYLFLFIELLIVSYIDVKKHLISNYWSIFNLIAFSVFLFIFPESYFFSLPTFIYSFLFLIVGFVLFVFKIMGAGDTKFLFSFFLVVPLSHHDQFMEKFLYMTIMVGGSLFIVNLIQNHAKIIVALKIRNFAGLKGVFGKKFSLAPVIFFSWLWLGWESLRLYF